MSVRDGVPDFGRLSVLVVGDLIADHSVHAEPRRLSREAPVMVLRHVSESIGAGGAANVARNLRALEADVHVLGVTGRDASGREVKRLLEEDAVNVEGIVTLPGYTTPTKMRILAAEPRRSLQQVLRIDREPREPASEDVRVQIAEQMRRIGHEVDAVLVSDYEYGLVGYEVAAAASELARAGKIVVLDPRRSLEGFYGLSAITPNVEELGRFSHTLASDLDNLAILRRAAQEMRERARARHVLVTRGNLGMALFGASLPEEGIAVDASGTDEITDVSGAGDTAAAVFTLSLAAGLAAEDAMVLANAASGVVVMESGAAVCSLSELREALTLAPRPTVLPALLPSRSRS
jgi:rfaE bifunctional protein kinase chain/domain